MTDTTLTFSEWLPDQADLGNPGLIQAKNCLPTDNGYKPLPSLVQYVQGTTDTVPLGITAANDPNSNTVCFIGDAAKLYRLNGSSMGWDDVSRASGYAAQPGEKWRFTEYGSWIVGSNFTDPIQYYDTNSSTIFADLQIDVKSKYLAVIGEFVVGGFINDIDGTTPNRLRWSGLAQPTNWAISPTSMGDFQDLPTGGAITGIVGGESGIVFCENAIYRMPFVGSPYVFAIDQIETNVGCIAPDSIAQAGNLTFFLSADGFRVTDGTVSQNIGDKKINDWFFSQAKTDYLNEVRGVVDPVNQKIMWSFAGASSSGTHNRILCFDYAINKFSYAECDLAFVGTAGTVSLTLEDLDTQYGTLDAIPAPLDSRLFKGGGLSIGGIKEDGTVQTFSGTAMDAEFITSEIQFTPGRTSHVKALRPIIDGTATVTASINGRLRMADTNIFDTDVSMNYEGVCPVRNSNRYHRIKVNTEGDFKFAQGVGVDLARRGKR